jgi:hypothetical protein
MADLKPSGQLPRLIGREGLIERADPMGVEIITHQANPFGIWIVGLKQGLDLLGPIHGGAMLPYAHMPKAGKGLGKHEDVGRVVSLILVVAFLFLSLLGGDRLSFGGAHVTAFRKCVPSAWDGKYNPHGAFPLV